MSIECALFGVLGRDAESKVSKSGTPYLRLNIRSGDGDAAQWINAMTFDPEAIALAAKFIKGARVYLEGTLKLDAWTGADGVQRHGLSAMSWHTRLAAIGKNKPAKRSDRSDDQTTAPPSSAADDRQSRVRGIADASMDDEIPFGPEWR
jgi:single-stranded DNA-binding protein